MEITSTISSGLHSIDDVIGDRYRLHALLGQGGTGSTYQAEDLQTHRWVAVKVMSLKQLGQWELLSKFEREAEALGRIDHPGVPDYIEHFQIETEDDCRFYLVQEFAAGKSLDKWIKDGWRASETEVKRIALTVLNTLVYLHQLDPPMVHRDIKPQNIIRQPDGRIYLVDFGAVQSAYRDALQQQGTFVGTMGYMPPEQLRGRAVPASDLYGLGATLVYLLTHRNPDELPMERMRIAFRGRVRLSEDFAGWLEKMLEPRLRERFGSALAAATSLKPKRYGAVALGQAAALGQAVVPGDIARNRLSAPVPNVSQKTMQDTAIAQQAHKTAEALLLLNVQGQPPIYQAPRIPPQKSQELSTQAILQKRANSSSIQFLGKLIVAGILMILMVTVIFHVSRWPELNVVMRV